MRSSAPTFSSTWSSPAKVNLCLRIVGRRGDGYHLLDSIFAAIDLADQLTISLSDLRVDRETSVDLHCSYPGVPNDATNLAARAARKILGECGLGADVVIDIEKRIPPGTGLGGGSSNAATVLKCMSAISPLRISQQRLHELALELGADVPFFLTGGCARVRGIGETIEPIPGWPGLRLIVALPPIAVSTAWAFRAYSAGFAPEAEEPARMASGDMPDASLLQNDLETAVLPAYPEIGRVKQALLAAGASAAVMSGSGSAIVALVPASTTSEAIVAAFQSTQPNVRIHHGRILSPQNPVSVDRTPSYA